MNFKPIQPIILLSLAIASVALSSSSQASVSQANSWRDKVAPELLDMRGDETASFFIHLTERADVSGSNQLRTKEQKGQYVFDRRTEVALRTQAPIKKELAAQSIAHQSFWIVNCILVNGNATLIEQMARRHDVGAIKPNTSFKVDLPESKPLDISQQATLAIEWGLNRTGAPAVWDLGFTGEGVVIGGQDTGVQWDHPAIKNMYRGWDGSTADHDYNWHDSVHEGGSSCGADSPEPCDDHSHGSHTIGTIVGDDGAGKQIGMAPGAKWIACRNMNAGVGQIATYRECFEFLTAPYPVGGDAIADGDPSKAPHATSNSWGCNASEGCTDVNVFPKRAF